MGIRKSDLAVKSSKHDFMSLENYEIYEIISPNGGGLLVDLMKTALKFDNYVEVDTFIRREVVKFLMKNGEGDMVCN